MNPDHLEILKKGVHAWNRWRGENPTVIPVLAVPIFPIIQRGEAQFSMFDDLYDYPWVLRGCAYADLNDVRVSVPRLRSVALAKKKEINARRAAPRIPRSHSVARRIAHGGFR